MTGTEREEIIVFRCEFIKRLGVWANDRTHSLLFKGQNHLITKSLTTNL